MLRRSLVLPLLGLCGLWAACSGEPASEENVAEQAARFGLISVTYSHDWGESGSGMVLSSAAQFVRFSALNREQVAQLLALPVDPERDLPALDRCRLYDLSPELAAAAEGENDEQGSVELLEAGELKVQTATRTVTLAPKHFPGLLPFVSGVVYGEAEAALVEDAGRVLAISSGGEAVGAFSSQVMSPELPRLLSIGAQEPGSVVPLGRDRDLTLRWTPSRSNGGDLTYLELRFARGKRDLALRCRLKDDGAFEVPAGQLSEAAGRVTLEIARLRRSLFTAGGLDQAELRVTVRDAAILE
jgi:hypothetical protein